jgi:hypothetical protein
MRDARLLRISVGLMLGVLATAAAYPADAATHAAEVRVSRSGLERLAQVLPRLIPSHLAGPNLDYDIGGVRVAQVETDLAPKLASVQLTPRDGALLVEVDFSLTATGLLSAHRAIASLGDLHCRTRVTIQRGRLVFKLSSTAADGRVLVEARDVSVELDPDQLEVRVSGCALGELVGGVVSFLRGAASDRLVGIAKAALSERIAALVAGIFAERLQLGDPRIALLLSPERLAINDEGLALSAGAALSSRLSPAACVRGGGATTPRVAGGFVSAASMPEVDVAFAFDRGLLEDAIYQAWRAGMFCFRSGHGGVPINLSIFHFLLPGIEPGAVLSMALRTDAPPQLLPGRDGSANWRVRFPAVDFDLDARLPSGGVRSFQADFDLEMEVELGLEPMQNALILRVGAIDIVHFRVIDPLLSATRGFDAAFVLDRLERVILPGLIHQFGSARVAGLGWDLGNMALLLRRLEVSETQVSAGVDLFELPADDQTPPETWVVWQPIGITSVEAAGIVVRGSDPEVPAELLRYRVVVDGVVQGLSPYSELHVAVRERSAPYRVSVAAVDPAGNADPTPVEIQIDVDGRAPEIALAGRAVRYSAPGEPFELAFQARDDRTKASQLRGRLLARHLMDPRDQVMAETVASVDVAPGATRAVVVMGDEGLYRIELEMIDEAGNRGVASTLVRVGTDTGCTVAGGGFGSEALMCLLVGAALRRRRFSAAHLR